MIDDRDEPAPDPVVDAILEPLRERHTLDPRRAEALWEQIDAARRPATRVGGPWALAAALAAAAGLSLWGVSAQRPEAEAPPLSAEASRTVAQMARPQPPTLLSARTELPGGAIATPGPGARVRVLTAELDRTRLALLQGRVDSQVPHLGATQSYVVVTDLAEVRVRGTRFSVALTADGATEVQVTEGRVEVLPMDGRPARFVDAGAAHRLEPLSAAGATGAQARGDWRQAADILTRLEERSQDALEARNLGLRAGRLLHAHAPAEAALHWARQVRRYPTGPHAEEFAFRYAEALRRAGDLEGARAAGATFRRRFPSSARAVETRGW